MTNAMKIIGASHQIHFTAFIFFIHTGYIRQCIGKATPISQRFHETL